MLKRLQKYKYHLLAFLIPIITLTFIYLIRCQLRDTTFFISDSYDQYFPLLSYFKDITTGNQSLLYSFSKGLGGPMIGTYAYYLASPLNWLIVFFTKKNMYIFFAFLIILKIGLSSLFMYIYINNKKIKNNHLKLILAICYALMAYNINYYFHIMWLDGIALAPLIILGIEKLIDKNKSLLYGITLFIAILSNYYIGFILCIFSCLYFIYYLFITYKKQGKKYILNKAFKFLLTSFLAGMSTMIILLPALLEFVNIDRNFALESNKFNILEFFSKGFLASNNYKNILNEHYVNWYTGIFVLVSFLLYFMNKKITLKEKIASLIMILIFIFSFKFELLNKIWHGFSLPNCFNYRYSFLLSLFLIVISLRNFENYDKSSTKNNLIITLVFVIISLLVILQNYEWINYIFVWISVCLFIIYIFMLKYIYQSDNKKDIKIINLLLLILIVSELAFNIFLTFRDNEFVYFSNYNDVINSEKIIYNNKNNLYRTEFTDRKTSNDSLGYDSKGFTTFLSTLNTNNIKIFSNFGYTYKSNSIHYNNNSTMIMDSLFGMKRIYSLFDYTSLYEKVDEYECSLLDGLFYDLGKTTCYIYNNDNALNLGYMIDGSNKNLLKEIHNNENNVFENQNSLLNVMLGNETKYFKKYKVEPIDANTYKYKVNDVEMLYIYMGIYSSDTEGKVNIYINDKLVTTLTHNDFGIQKIKNEFKDEEITIRFEVEGNVEIKSYPMLYYLDSEFVKQDLKELKKNEIKIKKLSNTNIKGKITATKNKNIMFTSIPYDKGWTVKVDGKKVKALKLYDAFLGVKLEAGEHKIEFSYFPPGLKLGAFISLISFIFFNLYFYFERKKVL